MKDWGRLGFYSGQMRRNTYGTGKNEAHNNAICAHLLHHYVTILWKLVNLVELGDVLGTLNFSFGFSS